MMLQRRRWRPVQTFALWSLLALAVAHPSLADDPQPKPTRTTGARLDFIDEKLRESWAEFSIKPSRVASDEEFLRRAYLDLLGRIPNISEANGFLRSKEAGKRAKLVEYLLVHPDYPKNFATIWKVILLGRKDQAREVDPQALTNWLRRQFNENRPWNEMAFDLIDAKGSNKENGAVNFSLAHMGDGAINLTSITTRVFLGQQIQCTQCHDHPSNDWKQADFWGINAFYKGLRSEPVQTTNAAGTVTLDHYELFDEPTDQYSSYERRDAQLRIAFPTFLDGRKISQNKDVDRREALARFITEPSNEALAKAYVNRMWGHFLGRGFVQPVDDFGAHNLPSQPELLDELARNFQSSGYDTKMLIRWIMNSEAYNLTSATTKDNDKDETLFSHMNLKPMTPEQLFDSLIVATAAHKTAGADQADRRDRWMRQFQFAFAKDEGEESSSFQGTIPQALMMMNGELMEKAVGGRSGSFLADLLDQARLQKKGSFESYVVDTLYLAALSRRPTGREREAARHFLVNYPDTIGVMEDMFWSLLNSNEFVLNR
ncbi:DUF1553 domain-containing protein [Tundrisphaera lichenicola]|uniref:DUF1553 domain-containing protein n=1 Tax=Tundrisphaera lichenicola TaxID=2029860 RepID=UPI003EC097A9